MIAKYKVDGQLVRNEWVITRNGFRFLRGSIQLPKFVLIKRNHVVERSDSYVSLTDVWRGAPYLETRFEYFDDNNNPIGLRPLDMKERQVTLV